MNTKIKSAAVFASKGGRLLLRNGGVLLFVMIAFLLGYGLSSGGDGGAGQAAEATPKTHVHEEPEETLWTCSMHPEVLQPEPGLCPKCGMELIPVEEDGSADAGPREFTTTESAKALMNIQTAPVERRFAPAEIRMVGKVDYDETRLGYITAWIPGRIDKMYVDYTGIRVNEGDHMVFLYSPNLLAAQDELRRAAQTVAKLTGDSPSVLKQTAESSLKAAREKLRRWGLTEKQIRQAEEAGITSDHVTIYAPMGGTVIERSGQEGMYVDEGTRIYTIADLSKVWVRLEAYESDLPWLHLGQTVEFTTEAYPGETFTGKVSFIDPVLDERTRTVNVRVNVPNDDRQLKPGMFVRAVVRAQVATGGRVLDPGLAGKWIGPMHPEIVKDQPGTCDICGMDLVRTEDLGYISLKATPEDMPLVIPASAPLLTGKRAVVYVEVSNGEQPSYEGREVTLGPRTGDYYIVESGLEEGERVVTNGNFKIDSALQILAKPSMMNPQGAAAPPEHQH